MTSYIRHPPAIIIIRGECVVSAELVGKVIQRLRKNKGMSQEVLSGLATLDRTHYSKIERGLRSPTIDTLFKIAHALDILPHELMIEIEKAVEAKEHEKKRQGNSLPLPILDFPNQFFCGVPNKSRTVFHLNVLADGACTSPHASCHFRRVS